MDRQYATRTCSLRSRKRMQLSSLNSNLVVPRMFDQDQKTLGVPSRIIAQRERGRSVAIFTRNYDLLAIVRTAFCREGSLRSQKIADKAGGGTNTRLAASIGAPKCWAPFSLCFRHPDFIFRDLSSNLHVGASLCLGPHLFHEVIVWSDGGDGPRFGSPR